MDAFTAIKTDYRDAFDKLNEYQESTKDWIFGYLTYDLKNDVEQLKSDNFDGLHFPDLYFFQPKRLFLIKGNTLVMQYLRMVDDEFEVDLKSISQFQAVLVEDRNNNESIKIKLRTSKDDYFSKVNQMLYHIHRGDIYEANFCQEFYSENKEIEPCQVYKKLNTISKTPFLVFSISK